MTVFGRYFTVSFVWCNDAFSLADLTYNLTITYRRPLFSDPQYTQYQFLLRDLEEDKR